MTGIRTDTPMTLITRTWIQCSKLLGHDILKQSTSIFKAFQFPSKCETYLFIKTCYLDMILRHRLGSSTILSWEYKTKLVSFSFIKLLLLILLVSLLMASYIAHISVTQWCSRRFNIQYFPARMWDFIELWDYQCALFESALNYFMRVTQNTGLKASRLIWRTKHHG